MMVQDSFFTEHPPRHHQGKCKGCGRAIYWLTTLRGTQVPLEKSPTWVYTLQGEFVKGYEPHFSRCPYANDFRRK